MFLSLPLCIFPPLSLLSSPLSLPLSVSLPPPLPHSPTKLSPQNLPPFPSLRTGTIIPCFTLFPSQALTPSFPLCSTALLSAPSLTLPLPLSHTCSSISLTKLLSAQLKAVSLSSLRSLSKQGLRSTITRQSRGAYLLPPTPLGSYCYSSCYRLWGEGGFAPVWDFRVQTRPPLCGL